MAETSGFAGAVRGQTVLVHPEGPEAVMAEVASGIQAEADEDVLAEAIGIRQAEQSRVLMAARWRAALGLPVAVRMADGSRVDGQILDAGPDVVAVQAGSRIVLIGLPAVVSGLPWVLADEAPGGAPRHERGPSWGRLLREGIEAGGRYRIVTIGAELDGTIEGVGRDHVDLAGDRIWSIPFTCILRCEER